MPGRKRGSSALKAKPTKKQNTTESTSTPDVPEARQTRSMASSPAKSPTPKKSPKSKGRVPTPKTSPRLKPEPEDEDLVVPLPKPKPKPKPKGQRGAASKKRTAVEAKLDTNKDNQDKDDESSTEEDTESPPPPTPKPRRVHTAVKKGAPKRQGIKKPAKQQKKQVESEEEEEESEVDEKSRGTQTKLSVESTFDPGDFVLAQLKHWPPWPARVISPKEVRTTCSVMKHRPSDRNKKALVEFYGHKAEGEWMAASTLQPWDVENDNDPPAEYKKTKDWKELKYAYEAGYADFKAAE